MRQLRSKGPKFDFYREIQVYYGNLFSIFTIIVILESYKRLNIDSQNCEQMSGKTQRTDLELLGEVGDSTFYC